MLGEDEWELVAIQTLNLGGEREQVFAYLKRPKKESLFK